LNSFKDLFKRNTRPQFPIQDTNTLSSKEVDYLILDLRVKNDDRKNWIYRSLLKNKESLNP